MIVVMNEEEILKEEVRINRMISELRDVCITYDDSPDLLSPETIVNIRESRYYLQGKVAGLMKARS